MHPRRHDSTPLFACPARPGYLPRRPLSPGLFWRKTRARKWPRTLWQSEEKARKSELLEPSIFPLARRFPSLGGRAATPFYSIPACPTRKSRNPSIAPLSEPSGSFVSPVRKVYCPVQVAKANYTQVETMLIAAFIFVISLGAMIQFMILTWRAGLVQTASQDFVISSEL